MRRGHDKMGCVDVGLDLSKMAYASIWVYYLRRDSIVGISSPKTSTLFVWTRFLVSPLDEAVSHLFAGLWAHGVSRRMDNG
jgi:hypothetical protein